MKEIILKKNILLISSGTVMRQNINGDYYPKVSDDAFYDGPLKKMDIVVDGQFIKSNPDYFEVSQGSKTPNQLIQETLNLLDAKEVPEKVFKLLNQAIVAKPKYSE